MSRKGVPNKNPYPTDRREKVCAQGHDKSVTGIGINGRCVVCARRRSIESQWKGQGIFNSDGASFSTIDFDRAYQVQQGRCAGCKKHQTEFKNRFHVDHDHRTGKFRWLLCGGCNHALGNARDNPITLRALADLLEGI